MHWAAESSVSRGMVVLKRFLVSILPELSESPASQASSLPTPGLLYTKSTLWLPFVVTVGLSDCLFFTVWREPSKVAPLAALNRKGCQVAAACCSGLVLASVTGCGYELLPTAPSQELLFYPASPVPGQDPVTHMPNPILLVGDKGASITNGFLPPWPEMPAQTT